MRLTNILILLIIICLFSSVFEDSYSTMQRMDYRISELKAQNDSLYFISESFYRVCEGYGFSSLDEWKLVCKTLWSLDCIDWGFSSSDENVIYGTWTGPYGEGMVYFKRKNGKE